MAHKKLDQCRTARDFIAYAESNGGSIERAKNGVKLYGPNGTPDYAVIHSNHPKDLPTGTRCALKKALLALGFMVLALAFVILAV